jgi:hypothetical protein
MWSIKKLDSHCIKTVSKTEVGFKNQKSINFLIHNFRSLIHEHGLKQVAEVKTSPTGVQNIIIQFIISICMT